VIDQPLIVDWLREWDRTVDPRRLRAYVRAELERLRGEGLPLLYAAATPMLPSQRDLALSVLLKDMGVSQVSLALVAGAKPPPLDPQGRPLPDADRGRVLRAKVGTYGQAVNGAKPDEYEAARYAAPARAALARTPAGLYRTADIGRDPTPLNAEDALAILTQWGHGVASERFRRRKRGSPGPDGKPLPGEPQDLWLVMEVSPETERLGFFARPQPKPGKSAA
jgi:hypothetical protein